jgi:hypothetical protein
VKLLIVIRWLFTLLASLFGFYCAGIIIDLLNAYQVHLNPYKQGFYGALLAAGVVLLGTFTAPGYKRIVGTILFVLGVCVKWRLFHAFFAGPMAEVSSSKLWGVIIGAHLGGISSLSWVFYNTRNGKNNA